MVKKLIPEFGIEMEEIPNFDKVFLMASSNTQDGKEVMSSIDTYNNHISYKSRLVTLPDGTPSPRLTPAFNYQYKLLRTKPLRFLFLSKLKAVDLADSFTREGDTRKEYFYTKSKLYIVDMWKYGENNTIDANTVRTTFETDPYYYYTFEPDIWGTMVDTHQNIIFGVTQKDLENTMMGPNDTMMKFMYPIYQDANGVLHKADTDEELNDTTIFSLFHVAKIDGTNFYTIVYNEEFMQEYCVAEHFWGNTFFKSVKRLSNTFKHQFFNPFFVDIDSVVNKYHIHVSADAFGIDLFSELVRNFWENTCLMTDHIAKLDLTKLIIKTTIPYTIETKQYGCTESIRINFDTSGMVAGEKTYVKISLDAGGIVDTFGGIQNFSYNYVINKDDKQVTEINKPVGKWVESYTTENFLQLFGTETPSFINENITFARD